MFDALSLSRHTLGAFACALAIVLAPAGYAQTIDFSLDLLYSNPGDPSSAGVWELIAKSSDFGIAGLTARISGIDSGVQLAAPRGTVNGTNAAGFQLLSDIAHPASPPNPAYHEFAIDQVPISPLPSGKEESYFYGVGTLTNGSPNYPGKPVGSNFIGPVFTSLTNVSGVAWATGDLFGDATWDTGVKLINGTFSAGMTPDFFADSNGNVFTSLGTSTTLGDEALATTITKIVRTNLANSADYNHNGRVDAPDYVLWRKTLGQAAVPPGSGADGDGDGTINQPDYDLWRAHFGGAFGSGAAQV